MRHRAAFTIVMMLAGILAAASAVAQTGASPTGAPATGASPTGTSGGAASTSLKCTDKTFVRKAAQGGLAEVELGRLAASRASDPDVKALGQRMVDDHSKANEQLRQVVAAKGYDLPTDLSASDKTKQARLDKLSGAAFDRAYVLLMLKDHQKDMAEFRRESKRAAADADVKGFAGEALPTLQDHLKLVQDLDSKMGGTSAGSARSSRRGSADNTNPRH